MMWELLQITILGTNSKIVGTRTFKKFPYAELTLKIKYPKFLLQNPIFSVKILGTLLYGSE